MAKVEIRSNVVNSKGHKAVDVVIRDSGATVRDYYEALDEFILQGGYVRTRSTKTNCEGCDICCKERIPLTSVDVLVLKDKVAPELALGEFLKRYTYIAIEGKAVDISLARDSEGNCLFLDQETGKCRHYTARPIVCRTYICTPAAPNANELRDIVVNSGEDELVRIWLGIENAVNTLVHEAWEPDVDPEDWAASAWSSKEDYAQIKLKDIIPPELWKRVYVPT